MAEETNPPANTPETPPAEVPPNEPPVETQVAPPPKPANSSKAPPAPELDLSSIADAIASIPEKVAHAVREATPSFVPSSEAPANTPPAETSKKKSFAERWFGV